MADLSMATRSWSWREREPAAAPQWRSGWCGFAEWWLITAFATLGTLRDVFFRATELDAAMLDINGKYGRIQTSRRLLEERREGCEAGLR
jgi:hypothetical protein